MCWSLRLIVVGQEERRFCWYLPAQGKKISAGIFQLQED
jgi:hypothetical protein